MSCNNCNERNITWQCLDCVTDQNYLCTECKTLHAKLKALRNHKLIPFVKEYTPKCCNCDINPSQLICDSCPIDNNCYCDECGVLHTKIKQNKNHHMKTITDVTRIKSKSTSDIEWTSNPQLLSLLNYFNNLYQKANISYGYNEIKSKPMLYSLGIALIIQICTRLLFKKARFLFLGLIILAGYLYRKHHIKGISVPTNSSAESTESINESVSSMPINDKSTLKAVKICSSFNDSSCSSAKEDENNEFWHSKEPEPPAFRARVREYFGRVEGRPISRTL